MIEQLDKRIDISNAQVYLMNRAGTVAFEYTVGACVGASPYSEHALVVCGRERMHVKPEDRRLHLIKHVDVQDRDTAIRVMSEDMALLSVTKWLGRFDEDFLSRVDRWNAECGKIKHARIALSTPAKLDNRGHVAFHLGELRRLLERGHKRLAIGDAHVTSVLESILKDNVGEMIDTDIPAAAALAYAVLEIIADEPLVTLNQRITGTLRDGRFKAIFERGRT